MQHTVTIHPHQCTTKLVFQGAEKVMVAVFGIGDDEVKFFEHLRLPVIAQSLDLLDAYYNVRLLAGHSFDGNWPCPTTATLRHPG